MSMSRIVILSRRYCPGQAWTNRTLAYAKGFAEFGKEVVIYYLIPDKYRSEYHIDIPGVRVVDLWRTDGWIARHCRLFSFIKNLLKFKREVKCGDSVFFYGGYDYQLWLAMKIRRRAKIFCEVTEHPDINGTAKSKFNIVNINEALMKLDGLFVISNALKEYYAKIGVDIKRIHIINMFVDINRFEGIKKSRKEKYIAYCGAVSYDKDGVNILIEAFSKFLKTHSDYRLRIIGKGLTLDTISRLKLLAQDLGAKDAIDFTGPVLPEEMPQLLCDAMILALARPDNLQAKNGFPTKLGEYLATGNPVVVTAVGEIPCFIKHGENGFLSAPDSISFAEQLCYVADNYDDACKVGLKGRELAYNAFSYKTQSGIVLNIMN